MRALVPVLLLALVAGCRAATPSGEGTVPPDRLGRPAPTGSTASTLPDIGTGAGTGAASPDAPAPSPTSDGATSEPTTPAPEFRRIAVVQDGAGDGGMDGPAYADIRAVAIDDDGANARIIVRLYDTVPNPMPAGEQMAVGVDLYREPDASESDYQVFAAGTAEGWLAYLYTPQGPVKYQGTFEVVADGLVFTVPWSALADLRGSRFSAFCDWDREGAVLNLAGEDHAPDSGRARFSR